MMTNKTLYLAVALSTGFHLAVLLPWVSEQQTMIVDTPTRPASNMTLVVSATSTPQIDKMPIKTTVEPATRRAPSTSSPATQMTPRAAETKTAQTREAEHKPAEQPVALAKNTDPHARVDHDMLEYLHSEFRVRFVYPLLARKRGWSGEVVIALNVNPHGIIDHVAVEKSSGHPLLDNNAVDTFRAIGLISPAIQSRINNTHQLSIPVVYQLTGG